MSRTVSPAEVDLEAVSRCLRDHDVPLNGRLVAHLVNGGRSNLTYRVTDGVNRWILRRPPVGPVLPGTHDVAREFHVMQALKTTVVPVPDVVLLVEDLAVIGAPFYLMEEVDGFVLRTREGVRALDEAQRHRLGCSVIDTLADLHQVDPKAVGLEGFGRPDGYLSRQVDRWLRQYHAIKVRDLPLVDVVGGVLRRTLPATGSTAVIHGDYRLDNVILDRTEPHRIKAVLDWEMATLGDPLADLATLIMFWDEVGAAYNPISAGLAALPGFPSRAEMIERYVGQVEREAHDVEWYLVFAHFRLAVILEQIHARALAGDVPTSAAAGVAEMVPEMLQRAADSIDASPRLRT